MAFRVSVMNEMLLGEQLDDLAPPHRHHRQGAAFFPGCRAEPLAALVEPYRSSGAMGYLAQPGEPVGFQSRCPMMGLPVSRIAVTCIIP
jgi:hypothetical protein